MLRGRERAILEAVCAALTPRELDRVAPTAAELGDFVEGFVERLPRLSVLGFVAALWLLELSTVLPTGRRLTRHDRARAAAALEAAAQSRLGLYRLAVKVVCGLGLMAIYAAPSVRAHLELPC
jgi:hypothetical protein